MGVAILFVGLPPSARMYNPLPNHCRNCRARTPRYSKDVVASLGKIYIQSIGRLGNILFQYAMLLSLRHNTSRSVYFISNTNLNAIFPGVSLPILKPTPSIRNKVNKIPHREEIVSGIYEKNFTAGLPKSDVLICCYFQSIKYFYSIREVIKKELTFQEHFKKTADNILHKAFTKHFGGTNKQEIRYVGIHVRRGDLATPPLYKRGYRLPKRSYFLKAKDYFKKRYPGRLLFVVATDDKAWAHNNLNASDTFFSDVSSGAQDMALLVACNDSIISLGSFSWWSGFLAGGEIIYFKDYKAKGSIMDRRIRSEDRFYSPDWIPMGNWTVLYQALSGSVLYPLQQVT